MEQFLPLEDLGLTKSESIVYTTLLATGTSKTGNLLKKSCLNSGKIYEILESLKTKGLVSESLINNIKHFTAAPPERILDYIREQKVNLDRKAEEMERILPRLRSLRDTSTTTRVVTYRGMKGMVSAVNEAYDPLNDKDSIVCMGVSSRKDQRYNKFWQRFAQKLSQKQLSIKYLLSERGKYFDQLNAPSYAECKLLKGITPAAVDVFGQEAVLIFNYDEPVTCILIYDKSIASSFKRFFEHLWATAE